LLDEQAFERWLALFTEDGTYWVPAVPGQADPFTHVSLFFEDRPLMEMRIARLRHPHAHGASRAIRTSRIVANVMVDSADGDRLTVRSRFQLVEFHAGRKRLIAGAYEHRLVAESDSYRIERKRVDLVDADGEHEAMQLFL
jgi:benzoate/toluate 1,2-dioxygenase beta subunit